MSIKVKDMGIKNHTYCIFDDIINIKNFDSNNIKIDKKSYKNLLIYYIGCVRIKDSKYVKINSVNPLWCITKPLTSDSPLTTDPPTGSPPTHQPPTTD